MAKFKPGDRVVGSRKGSNYFGEKALVVANYLGLERLPEGCFAYIYDSYGTTSYDSEHSWSLLEPAAPLSSVEQAAADYCQQELGRV